MGCREGKKWVKERQKDRHAGRDGKARKERKTEGKEKGLKGPLCCLCVVLMQRVMRGVGCGLDRKGGRKNK